MFIYYPLGEITAVLIYFPVVSFPFSFSPPPTVAERFSLKFFENSEMLLRFIRMKGVESCGVKGLMVLVGCLREREGEREREVEVGVLRWKCRRGELEGRVVSVLRSSRWEDLFFMYVWVVG